MQPQSTIAVFNRKHNATTVMRALRFCALLDTTPFFSKHACNMHLPTDTAPFFSKHAYNVHLSMDTTPFFNKHACHVRLRAICALVDAMPLFSKQV